MTAGPQSSVAVGLSNEIGDPHSLVLLAAQVMVGLVVSRLMMTAVVHEATQPLGSALVTITGWVPTGKSAVRVTLVTVGGPLAATKLVCTVTPSTVHVTISESPSGSVTWTV